MFDHSSTPYYAAQPIGTFGQSINGISCISVVVMDQ